jgi:hypothetical protein
MSASWSLGSSLLFSSLGPLLQGIYPLIVRETCNYLHDPRMVLLFLLLLACDPTNSALSVVSVAPWSAKDTDSWQLSW